MNNGITANFDAVSMVTGQSTVTSTVVDTLGHVVYVGESAYNGGALETISGMLYSYDTHNRLQGEQDAVRSAVATSHGYSISTSDSMGYTETLTAPDGVQTQTYDDKFGRIDTVYTGASETTSGYLGKIQKTVYNDADLPVNTYTCSCGTSPVVYSYDAAGRLTYKYEFSPNDPLSATQGSLVTHYEYPTATGKKTTFPNGSWKLEESYPDGRQRSITGSAQAPQYWSYAVNSVGLQVTTGAAQDTSQTPAVTALTYGGSIVQYDYLNRVRKQSTPAFGYTLNSNLLIDVGSTYDDNGTGTATGNLVVQTTTYRATGAKLLADHRFTYDSAGVLTSDGLDLNADHALTAASTDRITTHSHSFVKDTAGWLEISKTGTYAGTDATESTLAESDARLTGFSGGATGQVATIDASHRKTVQTSYLQPAYRMATTEIKIDGITSVAYTQTRNGYDYESQDFTGHLTRKVYDNLGRLSDVYSRSTATGMAYPYTSQPPAASLGSGFDAHDVYTYYNNTNYVYTQNVAGVGATLSYSWNPGASSRIVTSTDAFGNTAYTRYNALDLPDRIGGTGVSPVAYGYDGNGLGRRVSITSYKGSSGSESAWPTGGDTTTSALDSATGLVTSKIYADSSHVDLSYTPLGQLSSRKNARGTTTNYTYYDGSAGTLMTQELKSTSYTDGSIPTITYTYNRSGTLASVAQSGSFGDFGRTFAYASSIPANPLLETGEMFSNFYGAVGQDNRELFPKYDAYGRTTGFTLGGVNTPANDLNQTFGYKTNGQMDYVSTARGGGTAQQFVYTYGTTDAALPDGYTSGSFAAKYDFDPTSALRRTKTDGQWLSASLTRFDNGYDARGAMLYAKQSGSAFNDYYRGLGYSSMYNYYWYDSRNELTTAIKYRNTPPTGGSSPASADEVPGRRFEYRYDWAGNRQLSGPADPNGSAAALDDSYQVNNSLNQYSQKDNKIVHILGTAGVGTTVTSSPSATVTRLDRSFAADLVPSATPATGNVTITASVGSQNQSDTRPWSIGPSPQAFTYDADGNLHLDGLWQYDYDAENRLTSMTALTAAVSAGMPNQKIQFAYDYLGRRVMKRVSNWNGSAWVTTSERRYLYSGWNLVAEFEAAGTFALKHSYTWGLDATGSLTATGGIGALLQVHDQSSNADYLPTYDSNGNVSALVDASGNVAALYEYSAYGELLRSEGTYAKANPFRFSTKFMDDETGLYYYGQRFYRPSLGRFINRDPIGEAGGANLYGFVNNSPTNAWDVLGNSCIWRDVGGAMVLTCSRHSGDDSDDPFSSSTNTFDFGHFSGWGGSNFTLDFQYNRSVGGSASLTPPSVPKAPNKPDCATLAKQRDNISARLRANRSAITRANGDLISTVNGPAEGSTLDSLQLAYTYDANANAVSQAATVVGTASDVLGKTNVVTGNIFVGFGIVGVSNDFGHSALALENGEYGEALSRGSNATLGTGMLLGSRMAGTRMAPGVFGEAGVSFMEHANPLVATAQVGIFAAQEGQAFVDYRGDINDTQETIEGMLGRSDSLMSQLSQVTSEMRKNGCK